MLDFFLSLMFGSREPVLLRKEGATDFGYFPPLKPPAGEQAQDGTRKLLTLLSTAERSGAGPDMHVASCK